MSAGGLSYSGLQTKRRATLPSVEMWGTNMNILKDPNVGVFTRRIDKVGDTQNILLETEDSGDRASEYIRVYSRGVNPMVSVSYDNQGSNGGQNRSTSSIYGLQPKLPYQIEQFRPPILRQEDLLPLSRLPRVWYHAETNPEFPSFLQERECNQVCKTTKSPNQILRVPYGTTQCGGATEKTIVPDKTEGYARPQDMILRKGHDGSTRLGKEKVVWASDSMKPSFGTSENQLRGVMAQTSKSTSSFQKQTDLREKNRNNAKEIDRNRRIFEAFANKSMPHRGFETEDDSNATKKSINSNLLYIQAQTNNVASGVEKSLPQDDRVGTNWSASKHQPTISVEGFQLFPSQNRSFMDQMGEESSVVPTKKMLYKAVDTPIAFSNADGILHEQNQSTDASSAAALLSPEDILRVQDVNASISDPSQQQVVFHTDLGSGAIDQSPMHVWQQTASTGIDGRAGIRDLSQEWNPQQYVHSESELLRGNVEAQKSYPEFYKAGMDPSQQQQNFQRQVLVDRMQFATESVSTLPGADLGASVMYSDSVMEPERKIPVYSAYSNSQGLTTQESERADLPTLDRRSILVENMTTSSVNPQLESYTDIYEQTQTRTAKGGISNKPSLGSFLHNAAARPLPPGVTTMSEYQQQSTTDHRVNLRKKAFEEYMERSEVPSPYQVEREKYHGVGPHYSV